ncbi:MAG: XrtA system polysaccharide deacetylase [Rhizomicrobium sp.]
MLRPVQGSVAKLEGVTPIDVRVGGGRPAPHDAVRQRRLVNAMSIDVEDYFQVEAFNGVIRRSDWDGAPIRVDRNTARILDMLSEAGVCGTFFILGWVAERFPDLVKRIAAEGHEIASHGYNHQRADGQSQAEFRDDVRRAKDLLENITGTVVRGYRAPTFSVNRRNWWAYEVLSECGYEYSSSVYPIKHDLYGMTDVPRTPFKPTAAPIIEIPMATVRLFGKNLPCSGGGYFRLLPYSLNKAALRYANGVEKQPCIFYCHPWEFDAGQPRIAAASAKSRFRHYTNISRMPGRFTRLLKDFSWDRIDNVYLGNQRA